MTVQRTRSTRRRGLLVAGTAAGLMAAAPWHARAASPQGVAQRTVSVIPAVPMAQLHGGGPTGLLGVARDGGLWALSTRQGAHRLIADTVDPFTPLASGHGRLAARTAAGGLWVWDAATGTARVQPQAGLAPHAGLLLLRLAVLGVAAVDHRLLRFEASGEGPWQVVARSQEPVLPDARPLQVDLDARGDGGHMAVLAGPDAARYRHGVLGDAIEATRVLWLERHGLEVLRALELPHPHVFEDIAPRPVVLPGQGPAVSLLTVRSGPEGGQLAVLSADPAQPGRLQVAALGPPVGGFHRWLAPTTDGQHLLAVHTPHIGGVLHVYHPAGPRLQSRRLHGDVSTHRIGSRETDLAVWLAGRLLLPSQDGRTLRILSTGRDWIDEVTAPLPGPLVQATAWVGRSAWVGLLDDGRVVQVQPDAGGA